MNNLPNTKRKSENVHSFLAFLLFICFSFTSYYIQAQEVKGITLNVQNETAENVFNQLSIQTGLKFFYDQEIVNSAPRITLKVSNASLQDVLERITLQTKLYFNRDNHTISVGKQKTGQSTSKGIKLRNLKGRVVDQDGEPIIGASVLVKGTTNGVITDMDGNYNLIDVPENALLAFSYIGYQTVELKANGKGLDKIMMKEDNELLDEVVVVGYGVQKKRDVTTAIASIRASDLKGQPVTSMAEAIGWQNAGCTSFTIYRCTGFFSLQIKVRGTGTITAGTSPLYVVDGVPLAKEQLNTFNMNDVESIEVLKDASSSAIYGSRGSNGVVLITTKKGQEGRATVSYNGYYGWQTVSKKIDMLNAYEYADLVNDARNNTYVDKMEAVNRKRIAQNTNSLWPLVLLIVMPYVYKIPVMIIIRLFRLKSYLI